MIAAVALSACGSLSEKIAGAASEAPGIGLPADAPARPADPPAYPAVHDMPPPRASVLLTGLEQKKFEDDLVSAREEQKTAANPPPPDPKKKPPAKQAKPRIIPAANPIY
jgi:hypothetical protein